MHAPASNDLPLSTSVFQSSLKRQKGETARSLQIVQPSGLGSDLLSDTHSSVTFVEFLTLPMPQSPAAKQDGHCVMRSKRTDVLEQFLVHSTYPVNVCLLQLLL